MFNVGDKVVYPNQGVGVIDFIETKEFKGEMQKYYRIHLFNNSLKLMLPFSRVEPINLRLISDTESIDTALGNIDEIIHNNDLNNCNSKERVAINSEKIKSGSLVDYIEVICNLKKVNLTHNLNIVEKQMLNTSKKIVVEEISQSKHLSNEEAESLLKASIVF